MNNPNDPQFSQLVKREEYEDHSKRLTKLEVGLESVASSLAHLARTVDKGMSSTQEHFDKIHASIDGVKTVISNNGKIDWSFVVAALSFALLSLGAMGSFVILTLDPVKAQAEENRISIMQSASTIKEDYYKQGYITALLEVHEKVVEDVENRVHDQEMKASRLEALIEKNKE